VTARPGDLTDFPEPIRSQLAQEELTSAERTAVRMLLARYQELGALPVLQLSEDELRGELYVLSPPDGGLPIVEPLRAEEKRVYHALDRMMRKVGERYHDEQCVEQAKAWFGQRGYDLQISQAGGHFTATVFRRGAARAGSASFGAGRTACEAAANAIAKFEREQRSWSVGSILGAAPLKVVAVAASHALCNGVEFLAAFV
jgi:hypothetical protein